MLADLVIDEQLVILVALARDDPLVVLEEFKERIFSLL